MQHLQCALDAHAMCAVDEFPSCERTLQSVTTRKGNKLIASISASIKFCYVHNMN